MSDEYSLATKFLLGQIGEGEYERRMARLREAEPNEDVRVTGELATKEEQ